MALTEKNRKAILESLKSASEAIRKSRGIVERSVSDSARWSVVDEVSYAVNTLTSIERTLRSEYE